MDDYDNLYEDADPFLKMLLATSPLEKVDATKLITGEERPVKSAWISPSGTIYRVPSYQHDSVAQRICVAYGYIKTRLEMIRVESLTEFLMGLGWVRVWERSQTGSQKFGAEPRTNVTGKVVRALSDLQIASAA